MNSTSPPRREVGPAAGGQHPLAGYARDLHDHLGRLLWDPTAAAEITQATLEHLAGCVDVGDHRHLRRLLFATAHRLITSRQWERVGLAPLEDELVATGSEVDRATGAIAAAEIVWQAARGLRPAWYAALDLGVRRGFEPAEIAQVMGISRLRTELLLRLARRALLQGVIEQAAARGRHRCDTLQELLPEEDLPLGRGGRAEALSHMPGCDRCRRLSFLFNQPETYFAALPRLELPPRLAAEAGSEGVGPVGASSPIPDLPGRSGGGWGSGPPSLARSPKQFAVGAVVGACVALAVVSSLALDGYVLRSQRGIGSSPLVGTPDGSGLAVAGEPTPTPAAGEGVVNPPATPRPDRSPTSSPGPSSPPGQGGGPGQPAPAATAGAGAGGAGSGAVVSPRPTASGPPTTAGAPSPSPTGMPSSAAFRWYQVGSTGGGGPTMIAFRPNRIWFVDPAGGRIGHLSLADSRVTTVYTPKSAVQIAGMAGAGDASGGVWITDAAAGQLVRITAAGVVTTIPVPGGAAAGLGAIDTGPNDSVWLVETAAGRVGLLAKGATAVVELPLPAGAHPVGIVASGDGNAWVTDGLLPVLYHVTAKGVVTTLKTGAPGGEIQAGSDGSLWWLEAGGTRIAHASPTGTLREWTLEAGQVAQSLTPGPVGGAWFLLPGGLGSITPSGVVSVLVVQGGNFTGGRLVTGPAGSVWASQPSTGRLVGFTVP